MSTNDATWTVENRSVFGNFQVLQGTVESTDGAAQSDIPSGLQRVIFACASTEVGCTYTASGTFNILTAASGSVTPVMVFGV